MKEIIVEKGAKYRNIRLWAEDETRIGLMPIHRRRITAKGVRPIIGSQIKREYYYLFGLIEPMTGKDFMLELPSLDTAMMQLFMEEFAKEDDESLHLILLDNASSHTTQKLKVRENMVCMFLPACSPELNPIERFWKELKDWLSDYEAESLAEARKLVSQGLASFTEKAISSITSFEYLRTAWLEAIA
jgi:transposase